MSIIYIIFAFSFIVMIALSTFTVIYTFQYRKKCHKLLMKQLKALKELSLTEQAFNLVSKIDD